MIENTWYLEKFIVDDVEYYPPNNEEVSPNDIQLMITENFLTTYSGCNELSGSIVFHPEENYFECSEGGFSVTLAECQYEENNQFEYDYFGFFQNFTDGVLDPYYYEIISEGESLRLMVTNSLGSKAYYNNTYLSTSEVSNLDFLNFQLVFYNNDLIIQSSKSIAKSIFIYDLNGRLILTVDELANQRINVGSLRKGVYIVKVVDVDGNISTYKVRK